MAFLISRRTTSLLALSLTLGAAGCVQDLNVGGGGAGGTTTSETVPAPICSSGAIESCYDGPAATEGVAACHSGTRTCAGDGFSWGPCMGQILPDFEACAAPADMNCDGSTACTAPTGWSQTLGPDSPDSSVIHGTAVGPDHHLYVTGLRHEGVQLTAGPGAGHTPFLAKIAPDGEVVWVVDYDGMDATITGIAVDQTGHLRVAGTVGDHIDLGGGPLHNPTYESDENQWFFVAELDAAGKQIWAHTYDSHETHPITWLGADAAGNTVLFGPFVGAIDFGGAVLTASTLGSPLDTFLVKLDPDGNTVFARKQTLTNSPSWPLLPRSFRMSASGHIVTSGLFGGDLDLGGPEPLHAGFLDGKANGAYLAVYDDNGDLVWQRAYTSEWEPAVGISPGGDVLAIGALTADNDFGGGLLTVSGDPLRVFLARWNAAGDPVQSKAFHAGSYLSFAVSPRDDGTATLAASHMGGIDLSALGGPIVGADLMGAGLFRLGADDQITKSWHFEAPLSATDPLQLRSWDDGMGGFYAFGRYAGDLDLGFGPLPNAKRRAFLARYVP